MSILLGRCRSFLLIFSCGWLGACGGGGGNSGGATTPPTPASLTVPSSVSVSASTADSAAPTAQVKATVANAGATSYYFAQTFTSNGLASIDSPPAGSTGTFALNFKAPSSLAPGTYNDTLTIEACEDSACQQQIQGSPTTVTVQYVVSGAPGAAPVLNSIGPSAVMAGGVAFRLIATGSNFDSTSVLEWNGTPKPTDVLSSTLLLAYIDASDTASTANVAVTVDNVKPTGTTVSNALTLPISASVTPTLLLSTKALNASFDTSLGGGATLYHPVALMVNGSTSATYYYSVSFTGSAVGDMAIDGRTGTVYGITTPSGPTANRITGAPSQGLGQSITGTFTGPIDIIQQVNFQAASVLGAGSYTDTIKVNVCTDAQCTKPIAGSPQSIAVSYTVTGNPIPTTQFSVAGGSMVLEVPTSGSAPTGTLTISSNGLPPYGAYVYPSIGSGAAIASATVQSNLDGTATLTITGKPPGTLGSGIYTGGVQLQICFDSACTKAANFTQQNVTVLYVVDASPGVDFTQASIPVEVSDMAWNVARGRIYATANSDTGGISQSLLVINPTTATIEQTISLGQSTDPTSIVLSDDGNYAYIIDSISNQVLQVDLGTLTVTERVQISTIAERVKSLPGAPGSFAVQSYNNYTTLHIYDGTTPRPQGFSTGSLETNLLYTFGADASTVYAYDVSVTSPTMYQLSVSNSGLTIAQQTANVAINLGNNNDFVFTGGLVYTLTGSIYDPSTQSVKPPFNMLLTSSYAGNSQSYSFAVDGLLNRAYFMTDDSSIAIPGQMTLEGFNLTTQTPTWLARFPSSNPLGGRMIRWGSNGIAFVGGNAAASPNITLISGSIVSR
jgi:hypothetical protein